jgi:hypothetical protein
MGLFEVLKAALPERIRFVDDVRVLEVALDDDAGEAPLYELADPATDSLLPPAVGQAQSIRRVRVDRLDAMLADGKMSRYRS